MLLKGRDDSLLFHCDTPNANMLGIFSEHSLAAIYKSKICKQCKYVSVGHPYFYKTEYHLHSYPQNGHIYEIEYFSTTNSLNKLHMNSSVESKEVCNTLSEKNPVTK